MRRAAVLLAGTMAVVLAIGIAIPAFGGPSILKRVKKLERRMNATAAVAVHANHRRVRTFNSWTFMTPQGNGVWTGQATCTDGEVTGGGVASTGERYLTDNVIQSYPNGIGWFVEVHSSATSPSLKVYAVCTDVR